MRTLSGLGINPTGFDVDSTGNIYVAITSSNQIWKFIPTNSCYMADTNFGNGGYIGATNGASGSTNGQFNAPFDVAISPDGGTISVSDSGNDRIQQFSTLDGSFLSEFGTNGTDVGQFNTPKGLVYDSQGDLYVVDSGNDRIVFDEVPATISVSGSNGVALAQFSGPLNINISDRGVYVADTGNNRIQSFIPGVPFDASLANIRFAATNFSEPAAVAAVQTLTNEMFYVADTGNNRVLLCNVPNDNLSIVQAVWISMTTDLANGDVEALSFFSVASQSEYRQAFLSLGTSDVISGISQIGTMTTSYIDDASAEYYFTKTVNGQLITFPVEFDLENGVWKIVEF